MSSALDKDVKAERLLSAQEALTQLSDISRKDREGSILWTIHCLGPFWRNLIHCLESPAVARA